MAYTLLFSTLIIGGFLTKNSMRKLYLFIVILILLAIIGFRSPLVGPDTHKYISYFEYISGLEFENCLRSTHYAGEPFYVCLTWAMGCLSKSYVFYLLCWALFPCAALYYVLKNELELPIDYMVALLCLCSLSLFSFFMAGIRQTAAISLVFFGYRFLKNFDFSFNPMSWLTWDTLKFALCIFLAYNVHNSSLIFLVVLPFLKVKPRWWYLPIVVALFFAGSFFSLDFLIEVASLLYEERFANYGTVYESSHSASCFIMQFILFLLCFFKYAKLREKDKTNIYLFNLVLVGMAFQSFAGMIAEMFRISFYFSIFFLILVPRAIREYSPLSRSIIYPAFTILLLVYLLFLSTAALPEYTSSIF